MSAVQKALDLSVLGSGIDQNGNRFISMKLTYFHSQARANGSRLPEKVIFRNVTLPWSLVVCRKIDIEDDRGNIYEMSEFQSPVNQLFSPPGVSVLGNGEAIEGILRLGLIGDADGIRKIPSIAASRKARVRVSIPYYDLKEAARAYRDSRPLGTVNVSSNWFFVSADWDRQLDVTGVTDQKAEKRP